MLSLCPQKLHKFIIRHLVERPIKLGLTERKLISKKLKANNLIMAIAGKKIIFLYKGNSQIDCYQLLLKMFHLEIQFTQIIQVYQLQNH